MSKVLNGRNIFFILVIVMNRQSLDVCTILKNLGFQIQKSGLCLDILIMFPYNPKSDYVKIF